LDGITLKPLIFELDTKISGRTLKKIFMPTDSRFYLVFGKENMLVSLNSSDNYITLSDTRDKNDDFPSAFVMLLRKYIKNSPLINVSQLGLDRTIIMTFKGRNEFGDDKIYRLYIELMGRNSNMILCDENDRILDAFRRKVNDFRSVLPGVNYSTINDSKLNIVSSDIEKIMHMVKNSEFKIKKSLSSTLQGFSKKHIEEVLSRLDIDSLTEISKVDLGSVEGVLRNVAEEIRCAEELYVYYKDDIPSEISPLAHINKHTQYDNVQKFSPSLAIEKYFSKKKKEFDINVSKDGYIKIIKKEIKKVESNLENMNFDLSETSAIEKLQKDAELIVGNMYKFNPESRTESMEVTDWETGKNHIIQLNKLISISANAQAKFKKVAKLKRRQEITGRRIKKYEKHLFYLEQIAQSLNDCDEKNDLMDIVSEMKDQHLIKEKLNNGKINKKQKKKVEVSVPRIFEIDGFKIFVGKNNIQNDKITKESHSDDIWLHTQKIPGSHVIIKKDGKEVNEEILRKAAEYAAKYSKAGQSSSVPVDYTLAKNVWKPKGAKPGLVLYKNFKTLYVNPYEIEENKV